MIIHLLHWIVSRLRLEVFPLERALTPFSEYRLRLGIAIMIETGIQPKSAEAVKKWIWNGGKLKAS